LELSWWWLLAQCLLRQFIFYKMGAGMIEPTTPEEDEAFNEIERQAKQRMAAVNAAFDEQYPIWKRNQVIEEVAQHIEKLTGFGQDTISSFTIFIRGMKK